MSEFPRKHGRLTGSSRKRELNYVYFEGNHTNVQKKETTELKIIQLTRAVFILYKERKNTGNKNTEVDDLSIDYL